MNSASLAIRAAAGDLLAPVMRRRALKRRGTLFLCIHGVTPAFDPPHQRSSHLTLAEFEEVIDGLADVFRFVSIDRALALGDEPDDRPSAVVTFDDGYLDQFTVAAAALRRRGVPAVYYVTSEALADGRLHWFDRVRLALHVREAAAVFAAQRLPFDSRAVPMLKASPRDTLRRFLDALAPVEASVAPASHLRTVRGSELREFLADPLVTLGSHGASHVDLTAQGEDVRRDEIEGSRQAIESATGRSARHFAYPYGACDDGLVRLVRDAGYASAVTTERRWRHRGGDVHRVPRLIVGIGRSSWCHLKAATLP